MADADDDTTTAPPPPAAPAPTAATPDMLAQAQQLAQQFLPAPVQVDTTPVKRSWLSLLGEAVGGGKQIPMSPADEQRAGLRALGDFGTSLMAASHYQPGQTVFSNLAQGFEGAGRSMLGSEQMAAGTLAAQQGYQQQQLQNRLAALKEAIPLLRMQQAAGMPNPLAGGGGGAPIAAGDGTGLNAAGDSATRKAAEGGPPAPNTPAAAVAQRTHDFWIGQGYTEPQVAGIMAGGPGSESDFNSTVSGDKGTSYGLYQYHGERLANMQKYFGLSAGQMPSEAQQNQYAAFEISPKGPLASVGTQLQGAKTPAEAATIWTGGFGVPADKSEIARRANGANRYLGIYGQPPAQGGSATAGGPPASTASPAPVARPTAAPAGTIQGTPDTGGTQVGGPAALPGVIRPPGPLVPGDVGAIVGGMTKAGASPTTLAPGGGTAAPTAPTIAQGGPPTVTPPAQPTPQQPAQGDQPPAPTGPLTIEQYRAMHPSVINPTTYTVTPPNLDELRKSQAAAAQQLDMARKGLGGDPNKSLSDYNTATQAITKAQQDAQAKSLELQQAAQKNADDLTLQGYNAEMTRQQEARLKAQELAQTAAQAELERQNKIDLAKLQAGQTWHQKLQEQSAQNAQDNTLKPMAEQAAKAHQMNLGLAQLQPLLQDLPPSGGALGAVLNDHPDLAPLFNQAGILTDKSADAVRLVNGLVAGISSQMKPTGLGALREYEWDAFKSQLPSMLSTPVGQQKAIAMLMNFNNRIGSEASWMNNYFSRKVPDDMSPKPGAMMPAHNLESDNPTESVQQRMDRELGPIVPSAPPGTPQGQWEQSLPPGKPYYKSWALPDPKDPTGKTPLRDATGNVQTKTTLEVRPWR